MLTQHTSKYRILTTNTFIHPCNNAWIPCNITYGCIYQHQFLLISAFANQQRYYILPKCPSGLIAAFFDSKVCVYIWLHMHVTPSRLTQEVAANTQCLVWCSSHHTSPTERRGRHDVSKDGQRGSTHAVTSRQ